MVARNTPPDHRKGSSLPLGVALVLTANLHVEDDGDTLADTADVRVLQLLGYTKIEWSCMGCENTL